MSARTVYDQFKQRGVPDHIIAGIMGNMSVESAGFQSDINEISPLVKGSRGGYGLNQWTGPRRRQFEAFAQQRGADPSDIGLQVDFTLHELSTTEKSAGQRLAKAKTAEEAAQIYSENFLRPGIPHLEKRVGAARSLYETLGNNGFLGQTANSGAIMNDANPVSPQSAQPTREQIMAELQKRKAALLPTKLVDTPEAAQNGAVQVDVNQMQQPTREQVMAELERRKGAQPVEQVAQPTSEQPQADMSFMGRVKDNVIGVDDGVTSTGENIAAGINKFTESLTLGLYGDEARAKEFEARGQGSYDDLLVRERAREAEFAEEHPIANFAAEIAPAFIPVGAAVKGVATAGQAMKAGAVAGGTYGAMEGEGGVGNRLKAGGIGAGVGGLLGVGSVGLSSQISKMSPRTKNIFRVADEKPSIETLQRAKNEAYRLVDESGEVFSGDDMTGLSKSVREVFESGNYVEEVDNASRATLKLLEQRAGQDTSISQLDKLRQNLWKRYGSAKDQPAILDAIGKIDELVESRAGSSELMGAARSANAKFAKTQMLDDAFRKADDQVASTGSGGNTVNKYRQAVTNIINDKNKSKFFSEEEITLMRGFVRGSKTENIQRLIGKLSPSGNGLMMALHVVGGVSSGGVTLPIMAVGMGAARAAERNAKGQAANIMNKVSGAANKPNALLGVHANQVGRGVSPLAVDAQEYIMP